MWTKLYSNTKGWGCLGTYGYLKINKGFDMTKIILYESNKQAANRFFVMHPSY